MLYVPFFQSRRPLPLNKRVTFNNECECLLDIYFRLTKNNWAFYRYLLTDLFALSDCFMDCVKAMPRILVWSVPYLPSKM